MKVTVCAPSPFTAFYDAGQLHKYGMLHKLITQYPKFKTRQRGIPDELVCSFLISGCINKAAFKYVNWLGDSLRSRFIESRHRQYSVAAGRHLPPDTDVLYGLSSFMLEAMREAQSTGIFSIVYHGSLHERAAKEILLAECDEFGFAPCGNCQYEWLMEREDEEFASADTIIVGSGVVRKTMIDYGVPDSKITVIHRGANISLFYPEEKEDKIFRIIFCGGLTPLKGVHYLVRAFSELALPGAELWLIGSLPQDSQLKRILHKYSSKNIILKGTFPQHELRNVFCQGSVFVHPSLADGWPGVVSQAMACGLPVIVTDMTGNADIIINGQNGFIVKSRSIEVMKEKILFFYEHPELCAEMGKNALDTAKDKYNWDAYGERLRDVLSNVYRSSRK